MDTITDRWVAANKTLRTTQRRRAAARNYIRSASDAELDELQRLITARKRELHGAAKTSR